MTRRMEYTIGFDAPAEKIYQDLTSREYWQTMMGMYGSVTPRSEVTSFRSDENGTDIVFVHIVPRSYLPPIGRSVMPVDMVITRTQHYDPFDHANSRATGAYSASIPRGPGHFRGRYVLTETDTGSALRLTSACKVHIPLLGGALEELILHHITDIFDAEEAFTAEWISKHH
ncbi:MAG TPA: DUF2505 domain-containing protein [Mycobacterium sp.]|nr:DUF2505 domain-containing protein [Mycobacterium sp.]